MATKTKATPKILPEKTGTNNDTFGRFWENFKNLVREGNSRRVVVRNREGEIQVQFSLTVVVVIAILAWVPVVIGIIAALIAEYSITVERK